MIEFLRDPETGYVYAYRDGELVGPVPAMGDEPPAEPSQDLWMREHGDGSYKKHSGSKPEPVKDGTH